MIYLSNFKLKEKFNEIINKLKIIKHFQFIIKFKAKLINFKKFNIKLVEQNLTIFTRKPFILVTTNFLLTHNFQVWLIIFN